MASGEIPRKLWEHPDPESTPMWRFMQDVNKKHSLQLKTFADLHGYSIRNRAQFYADVWEASELVHEGSYVRAVDESRPIDAVPRWFEGVSLNFAENLLWRAGRPDSATAATEVREGGSAVRHVSWGELRQRAGRLAAAMRAVGGVGRGDRVVAVAGNGVDTLLVWLAATWLGAVFSSSSTDMGVEGILQRTVQVNPKLLFFDDAALYNGKTTDLRSKMAEVVKGLRRDCSEFRGAVSLPRFAEPRDVSGIPGAETLDSFLARGAGAPSPEFVRIPFHEPFLICYSSGTTGVPKAIVHSVGGVLLNYYKEGRLHEGTGPESVTLQYTTAGWIMYVACVLPLMVGARTVLYDGSPFRPDPAILVRVAAEQRATKLGISPRWMLELARARIAPRDIADLSALRTVTCTGMVLSDELFEWFYDRGFPARVHLANISGGTDIAGCFGLMNPLTPVYVGGTQGPSLGVHVAVYDALLPDGPGKEVPDGESGELVAAAAFPNTPCFFWNDENADGSVPGPRYRAAYFARFDRVWAHGDFCRIDMATGNVHFLGRADGVLNPSGVRFGSAEIYAVVERRFADRVAESLCVGQRRPGDSDESVMLFLLMRPGHRFDRKLAADVKEAIRRDLSKRHVPRYVFETPEIPTTVNLKKVELPVKQIVSGQTIKPSGTLANPQSLEYYYQFAKVEEIVGPKEKL